MKNLYIGDTISQSSIKCFDKHHYSQYPFLYNMQMEVVNTSLNFSSVHHFAYARLARKSCIFELSCRVFCLFKFS